MDRVQQRAKPDSPQARADAGPAEVAMLRALAHPVRLEIMLRLAARPETCACDFTDLFDVSQPTISQHLKVLRVAGLVRTRRRGTQICYSIQPGSITCLQDLVTGLRPELSPADAASTTQGSLPRRPGTDPRR